MRERFIHPFVALCVIILVSGCQRTSDSFNPSIQYSVQEGYLKELSSPFTPLSDAERSEDWGKESFIGKGFGKQLDLYQSITAFKRAEILIPKKEIQRIEEFQYDITLCYYLGLKYKEVIYEFEQGPLRYIQTDFPAFHDLLVILYDSYAKLNQEEKATALLETIRYHYPETAQKLTAYQALMDADFSWIDQNEEIKDSFSSYQKRSKSQGTAQALNAFLPGAGYLYLGQKQSALTAFLLNAAFIGATYHFFDRGHIAAGIIFLSFEFGWYFGGIFGVGLEAKEFNKRLFEQTAIPLMEQKRLFPVLNLRYAF